MALRMLATVLQGAACAGALIAIVLAASCDDEEPGGEANPVSSSSQGGGGAGAGGDGGGGEGGSPPSCPEQPCKLVEEQCGCPAGQSCQLVGGVVGCAPEGEFEPGRICETSCRAGSQCNHFGGVSDPSLCRRYCEDDDDCLIPGGVCVVSLGAGLPMLCTENCDPVTDIGCAPEDDLKCEIGQIQGETQYFTFCGSTGVKAPKDVCSASAQCGHGYGCFGVGASPDMYCLQYCWNPPSGLCDDPTAQCVPFSMAIIIGSVQYGACVPEDLAQ